MAVHYKSSSLFMENTRLLDLAASVGTPVYCYSLDAIRKNYREFADNIPGSMICYAVKANPNVAIIKAIANMGGGADVVSEGELRRAVAAGISPSKIIFSGVGKTQDEIRYALTQGIFQINVESLEELNLINQIASTLGLIAPVAIRVNPNIDAKTNVKITTGLKINKFGIPEDFIDEKFAQNLPNIVLRGISIHIGSQISNLTTFFDVIQKTKEIVKKMEMFGHAISRIDLGGGLGIPYEDKDVVPSISSYAKLLKENICNLGYQIICEPGRALVGNSGVLLTKVLYAKSNEIVKHIIVDAGMNDLIRPALYDCMHRIIPVELDESQPKEIVDIVGPVCESDCVFARRYSIPAVTSGDVFAICDAGAYGASMSSTYNSRLLIPEVLVNVDKYAVIRKRGTYDEMLKQDLVPDWLK